MASCTFDSGALCKNARTGRAQVSDEYFHVAHITRGINDANCKQETNNATNILPRWAILSGHTWPNACRNVRISIGMQIAGSVQFIVIEQWIELIDLIAAGRETPVKKTASHSMTIDDRSILLWLANEMAENCDECERSANDSVAVVSQPIRFDWNKSRCLVKYTSVRHLLSRKICHRENKHFCLGCVVVPVGCYGLWGLARFRRCSHYLSLQWPCELCKIEVGRRRRRRRRCQPDFSLTCPSCGYAISDGHTTCRARSNW